jgi:hypothetical protein
MYKKSTIFLCLTLLGFFIAPTSSLAAKFGYGLAYIVHNTTLYDIYASDTKVPSRKIVQAKVKKYSIGKGDHQTKESSMYIKDEQQKTICRVNFKVKAKNPFFKDPEITHKSASINQYLSVYKCVILSTKETKVDGDEAAAVVVNVIRDETINPNDTEPK